MSNNPLIDSLPIPHIIKYMGSKRNLLNFVVDTIQAVDPDGKRRLYDVFAGSAVVSGAFRNLRPVNCNDIQHYSSVIGELYLTNYDWDAFPDGVFADIMKAARKRKLAAISKNQLPVYDYSLDVSYKEMVATEEAQRKLIDQQFEGFDHLFLQKFSGTYWSLEQCLEIDAIAAVARQKKYKSTFLYPFIHGALMFAMAYCSQSTGHYAQYRDVTEDNLDDILLYRRKSIFKLFEQKLHSLRKYFDGENNSDFAHRTTNLDFLDAILQAEKGSIIYADPPYQFVHYSRFYHALETLVRYDYPEVRYKGRYRTDRHQSPFCIRTKVKDAFAAMFAATVQREATLVLSYSDNGMISMEEIIRIAEATDQRYRVHCKEMDYLHSTMGRSGDKYRAVKEVLLIFDTVRTS